ncbi:MAG: AtpZ/AtpI family protein [Chloroflexi bacterium]|nr:AtpZ/AtpI family protein [Chloroflexota bacterium]
MSQTDHKEGKNRFQYTFNLALAAVAGQVGCLTTIIVVAALLAGLWIDTRLNTRPTFTIVLVVLSVPLTLAVMLWVVKKISSRIKPAAEQKTENIQEEANRGTDT